jgi:hypothetical protein
MRPIVWTISIAALLAVNPGCSHEPQMTTRTYDLPRGDTSWRAVDMVLQDEWHSHEVLSQAQRSENTAVVRTTPLGHEKIRAALAVR